MMPGKGTSRRDYLKLMAAGSRFGRDSTGGLGPGSREENDGGRQEPPPDHDRRIQWWHEAKFGMFIHWGLYSVIGRHEWAMEMEGIPIPQYEHAGQTLQPQAERCARLGEAGQAGGTEVHGHDHQAP